MKILEFFMKQAKKITINGDVVVGRSVIVTGDKVIVDGVDQTHIVLGKQIQVTVEGDVETLKTVSGDVTANNVGSIETTSGDVECKDVSGNVETMSGDIECWNITGKVSTMSGDITVKGTINGQ